MIFLTDIFIFSNLIFSFSVGKAGGALSLDGNSVQIAPAASSVKYQCSYPSTINVATDNKFTVKGATASGETIKTGNLATGFGLKLYVDENQTKEATIQNVIIGYPLYGDMTWSVTSVQSVVNYFIHQCELVDANGKSVKFIRNNCYSSALGAANKQHEKLVAASSKFVVVAFIIGDNLQKMENAVIKCAAKLCLKTDATCIKQIKTKTTECDTTDGAMSLAAYKYIANAIPPPQTAPCPATKVQKKKCKRVVAGTPTTVGFHRVDSADKVAECRAHCITDSCTHFNLLTGVDQASNNCITYSSCQMEDDANATIYCKAEPAAPVTAKCPDDNNTSNKKCKTDLINELRVDSGDQVGECRTKCKGNAACSHFNLLTGVPATDNNCIMHYGCEMVDDVKATVYCKDEPASPVTCPSKDVHEKKTCKGTTPAGAPSKGYWVDHKTAITECRTKCTSIGGCTHFTIQVDPTDPAANNCFLFADCKSEPKSNSAIHCKDLPAPVCTTKKAYKCKKGVNTGEFRVDTTDQVGECRTHCKSNPKCTHFVRLQFVGKTAMNCFTHEACEHDPEPAGTIYCRDE